MILTQGARGGAVQVLQNKLNRLGEHLQEDGVYGILTLQAVKRFQSQNGLEIDGIAGGRTLLRIDQAVVVMDPFQPLKPPTEPVAQPDRPPESVDDSVTVPDDSDLKVSAGTTVVSDVPGRPEICRDIRLKDPQYVNDVFKKTAIVLHHTEGASAQSTIEYWGSSEERIATAYVVERDGTIYEVFDPKYWAWHLGSGKSLATKGAQRLNAQTVGIELANEGELQEKDGVLYCFGKPYVARPWGLGCNEVVRVDWRGGKVWAAYPAKQVAAVALLLKQLCDDFGIPFKLVGGLDYDKSALQKSGIYCHCTVREDKTDLHPGAKGLLSLLG